MHARRVTYDAVIFVERTAARRIGYLRGRRGCGERRGPQHTEGGQDSGSGRGFSGFRVFGHVHSFQDRVMRGVDGEFDLDQWTCLGIDVRTATERRVCVSVRRIVSGQGAEIVRVFASDFLLAARPTWRNDYLQMTALIVCVVALLASGLTFFSGFGLGTLFFPAFALFSTRFNRLLRSPRWSIF